MCDRIQSHHWLFPLLYENSARVLGFKDVPKKVRTTKTNYTLDYPVTRGVVDGPFKFHIRCNIKGKIHIFLECNYLTLICIILNCLIWRGLVSVSWNFGRSVCYVVCLTYHGFIAGVSIWYYIIFVFVHKIKQNMF